MVKPSPVMTCPSPIHDLLRPRRNQHSDHRDTNRALKHRQEAWQDSLGRKVAVANGHEGNAAEVQVRAKALPRHAIQEVLRRAKQDNPYSGGTTFNMTQGMYYNEDVVANTTNGWFFRTATFGGNTEVGMWAFDNYTQLLANSNFYVSGFTGGDQNGANRYWAGTGSTCWRSNVQGGVVTSFSVFASGPDLYNNVQSFNVASNAGYDANTRFMTIESSLIPAPGAIAMLAFAGVGISRRRRA